VEIVLASASPRRREILSRLGIPFRVAPSEVDETFDAPMPPAIVAETLARRKAESVAKALQKGIVIGADTLVALGPDIIGKPANRAEAVAILSRLSGTRHAVITGVCVIDVGAARALVDHAVTWVTMRRMTPEAIAAYVASGEADGKAGAYALQETADRYVERLEGDFDNVVGLPLALVRELIRRIGEITH
jgi:septum formation protein